MEEKWYTPEILPGDAEILKQGRPDFIVFNYYTTQSVEASSGDGNYEVVRGGNKLLKSGEDGVSQA